MIKKYVLVVLLSVSTLLSAQEVNVKKDIVLVDGKEVAKISKENRTYKLYDLSGNYLFSAENIGRTVEGNPIDNMICIRLTGENGNVREIEPTNKAFTLSNEKMITRNLAVGTAAFFSSNGIDRNLINEFFSQTDTPISNRIDDQYRVINKAHKEEDELAQKVGLKILANGDIVEGKEKIGAISDKKVAGGFFGYQVIDKKGNVIVKTPTLVPKSFLEGTQFTTFDGKTFVANAVRSGSSMDKDPLAERIVRKLYANGYTFKNTEEKIQQYEQETREAYNNKYKETEANSANLVEVQGYILDKKGSKIEGLLSIPYENIEKKMSSRLGGMEDLTNYGGFVIVKDEQGKTKSYKAKDGILVYAGDRVFVGAKGINDDALGNSSGSQLSILGESQFFEVDYENTAGYIVHHPKNPQYFYVKLKNSNEASYLGNKGTFSEKSESRLQKIFDSSIKCSALKFSDYDVNTKDGLIKIMNDFENQCMK